MATTITEFDAVAIRNASVQFYDGDTATAGTPFGCVGSIEGETESKDIVKVCEGVEVKKRSIAQKMNLTISAHLPVEVARKIFGISGEGMKPGVYAYGPLSKGKRFILTADVVDEFEDEVKKIAFTNASNDSGFQLNIENGQDEVALLEMNFTALKDDNGYFYYEAFEAEIEDQDIKTKWHTQFTPELVALATP